MRKWSLVPGTRALMWVNTRSSQPKCATSRYDAARSTRTAHSSGETASFSDGTSSLAVVMSVLSGGRGLRGEPDAVEAGHVVVGDLAPDTLRETAQVLVEEPVR